MLHQILQDVPKSSTPGIFVKPSFVTLELPRKITSMPQVAAAAERPQLSSNASVSIVCSVIKDSGSDVNDFILSTNTTRRARKKFAISNFNILNSHFMHQLKKKHFF